MSKVQEITHQVPELFRDFGIKSLTMDDISSSLGISKKTLYKYVSDKNDLVNKVISSSIEQKETYLVDLIEKNNHPIDELVSIAKFSIIEISSLHPTVQFDLKNTTLNPGCCSNITNNLLFLIVLLHVTSWLLCVFHF